MFVGRRRYLLVAALIALTIYSFSTSPLPSLIYKDAPVVKIPPPDPNFLWRTVHHDHPVTSFRELPTSTKKLPSVQVQSHENPSPRQTAERQKAIKDAFIRCWTSYKKHAWLHDELAPISGKSKDTFGGWGATLVDSLDTLWIMDLREEFHEAVAAVDKHISDINVFETTIRFLGGFLAAYDLSGDIRLLNKARDVGDMLCKAFDTPNHFPVTRWDVKRALDGVKQFAAPVSLLAEISSLSMEFSRLSLISGDPKYYTLIQNISERLAASQNTTDAPGLWPILVDTKRENFDFGSDYSLGGMSDSTYEYLPKMTALLGENSGVYQEMTELGMKAAAENLLFRPKTPSNADILFPGTLHVRTFNGQKRFELEPASGHLTCFTGGMYALSGRLSSNAEHLELAEKLTMGCVWAYNATTSGVMPEVLHFSTCPHLDGCAWEEFLWHQDVASHFGMPHKDGKEMARDKRLPPGVTGIDDSRYILRPEAIESVFVMYRVTGEERWRDMGWEMWEAIDALTRTELANGAVMNANAADREGREIRDSMESFWLGETLKYFYLLYSDPTLLSLDEWVFNTEAHAFRRL